MLLEVLATRCLLVPGRFWAINKLSVWFFMDLRGSLGSPLDFRTATRATDASCFGGHSRGTQRDCQIWTTKSVISLAKRPQRTGDFLEEILQRTQKKRFSISIRNW